MLRGKSQTYVTSIGYQERIEVIPKASTFKIETTTSKSLLASGRVLALVAISGVPVSLSKRR